MASASGQRLACPCFSTCRSRRRSLWLLWRCGLCRRSPIIGYIGPTTLFVSSVAEFVRLKFKL